MSCFSHLPLPPLPVQSLRLCGWWVWHSTGTEAQHRPRRVWFVWHTGGHFFPPSPLSSHTEQRKVSLHGDETTKQEQRPPYAKLTGSLPGLANVCAESNGCDNQSSDVHHQQPRLVRNGGG